MTILDFSSYIMGLDYTRESNSPERADVQLYNIVANLVEKSFSAKINLETTEVADKFFAVEPDIASEVPKKFRSDIFYALKNGYLVDEIPSKALYIITKAYNNYKLPNLIFKQVSDKDREILFQRNYLASGFTYRDIICSLFNPSFEPLSDKNRVIKYDTFSEVYVASTDMVAAIPNVIVENLSRSDVHKIEVDNNGLKIGNTYLRTLGGLYGSVNSIYDLRECL